MPISSMNNGSFGTINNGSFGNPVPPSTPAPYIRNNAPQGYGYGPPAPAVKPDDPEMMNFVALDDLQINSDEVKRIKLVNKRREFLKTDLTWKQVLYENDPKKRFADEKMLCGIAKSLGYEYVYTQGKVYAIVENSEFMDADGNLFPGEAQWILKDTGLVEDDINEVI